MSNSRQFIFTTLAACLLVGCATNTEHISPTFGHATEAALNKQIVTTAIAQTAPVMNPQKANAAVKRYLEDNIKEPKATTEITTEVD